MDFKNSEAIYIQIANFITEGILMRRWEANEKIPSVRELAVELQVNPNTAMRSFEYLQNKEIIYNKRGIGFFVSPNAGTKIIEEKREIFLEDDLPSTFKKMEILNISIDEIVGKYQKFKQNKHENK